MLCGLTGLMESYESVQWRFTILLSGAYEGKVFLSFVIIRMPCLLLSTGRVTGKTDIAFHIERSSVSAPAECFHETSVLWGDARAADRLEVADRGNHQF